MANIKRPGYSTTKPTTLAKEQQQQVTPQRATDSFKAIQSTTLRNLLRTKTEIHKDAEWAQASIEAEGRQLQDVTEVSAKIQSNFKILGMQINILSNALVKTERKFSTIERSFNDKLLKLGEILNNQSKNLFRVTDSRLRLFESNMRGFMDKVGFHESQIDKLESDIAFLKARLKENEEEAQAWRRSSPEKTTFREGVTKASAKMGAVVGGALIVGYLAKLVWDKVSESAAKFKEELTKWISDKIDAAKLWMDEQWQRIKKNASELWNEITEAWKSGNDVLNPQRNKHNPMNWLPDITGGRAKLDKLLEEAARKREEAAKKKLPDPPMKLGAADLAERETSRLVLKATSEMFLEAMDTVRIKTKKLILDAQVIETPNAKFSDVKSSAGLSTLSRPTSRDTKMTPPLGSQDMFGGNPAGLPIPPASSGSYGGSYGGGGYDSGGYNAPQGPYNAPQAAGATSSIPLSNKPSWHGVWHEMGDAVDKQAMSRFGVPASGWGMFNERNVNPTDGATKQDTVKSNPRLDIEPENVTQEPREFKRTKKGTIDPNDLYSEILSKVSLSGLNGFVPKDGKNYGITTGAPEEWANYLTQLAKKESSFNPNTKNISAAERAISAGAGSHGLFQLSPADARTYKLKNENFSYEELYDPNTNIDIAIKIHEHWMKKTGSLRSGAGKYWGPVKRGWTPGENKFQATTAGTEKRQEEKQRSPHQIVKDAWEGREDPRSMVVDNALKMLGAQERRDRSALIDYMRTGKQSIDPASTAWCAAFVNASLEKAGIQGLQGKGKFVASNYLKWGNEVKDAKEVVKGDVLVYKNRRNGSRRALVPGQTGGHVGLATGQTRLHKGRLQLEMLGGNQGRAGAVTKQWVNANAVGIRRAQIAKEALVDKRVKPKDGSAEFWSQTRVKKENIKEKTTEVAKLEPTRTPQAAGERGGIVGGERPKSEAQEESQVAEAAPEASADPGADVSMPINHAADSLPPGQGDDGYGAYKHCVL